MNAGKRSDASTGGQWNFSGVLYQLLVTLKTSLTATVEEITLGRASASARIVVEPNKGGDAQVHQPGIRTVDQIKIRRGQAPWTTRILIEEVLPDLFKARGHSSTQSRYRFITDNLSGTAKFSAFLALIHAQAKADKPPAELGRVVQPYRWGNSNLTEAALFAKIVDVLEAPEAEVWAFLASTSVEGWSEAKISIDIDTILAELVSEREEIAISRKALQAQLLGLGTVGASMSVDALLHSVGLDPARLTLPSRLPGILRAELRRTVELLKYDGAMDVRGPPVLPQAELCVLSGDSGQGKTWRLCRAGLALADQGRCAILLRATGTLVDLEAKIIELTWLQSYDRPLSLAKVSDRLRPKLADGRGVWLTLLLDDLADPALASALAQAPWASMGIQVVISAQNRITRKLSSQVENLPCIAVPDFTLAELRDYLHRAGRDSNHVPDDVLLSLTRPVLCGIYAKIPESTQWSPVSEYTLMDRYWNWATTEVRDQPLHADDGSTVLRLAGSLFDGPAVYPWTSSIALQQGLTEGARDRLITVGMLREDATGRLQLAHDRILNWAVAGEIERRILEGVWTLEQAATFLARLDGLATTRGDPIGRRLGYVLHDLLWKLARSAKAEETGTLALLATRSGGVSWNSTHFFEIGLGSLGDAIVPALDWMARQSYTEVNERFLSNYIALALVTVAESASADVVDTAAKLVRDDVFDSRSIGLEVLGTIPAPQALDLLWSINQARKAAAVAAKDDSSAWMQHYRAKKQSLDALSCAVREAPNWLRTKLLDVNDGDDAEQLCWLLMDLELRAARPIWNEVKDRLLDRLSPSATCAPRAVRHFQDVAELDRADAGMNAPDRISHALWFHTLLRLDLGRALAYLEAINANDLQGTSHWWMYRLIWRMGPEANSRLRAKLVTDSSDAQLGCRATAMLYSGQLDCLDVETFDFVIDGLETCLAREAEGREEQPGVRRHLRTLVASVTSPHLLERLTLRLGSRFEQLVTQRAMARTGRASMTVDRTGDEYHRILAAIGGNGYDQLVLAELDRKNLHGRTDGVTAAMWTTNPQIRTKLEAIADEPGDSTYNRVQLMHSLAAHRADSGLRTMVRAGSPIYLDAVSIRNGGPPLDAADIAQIETLLKSKDVAERLQGIHLVGFLGSEAAGSLLLPIFEDPASTPEEAGLARGVLMHLDYYQPSLLAGLKAQLALQKDGEWIASFLAESGDPEARAVVVDWLAAHPLKSLNMLVPRIAFYLLAFEDSASGARAFLKRLREKGLGWGDEGKILAALAEGGDETANAELDAVAYRTSERETGSAVAAIAALAKSSVPEAFAAAERLYRQTRSSSAAHLIVSLDALQAVEILLDDYTSAAVPVRHMIGRLLRHAAPREALMETLDRLSADPWHERRQLAAEMSGWLPHEQAVSFLEGLVDDSYEEVEKAALDALRRRQADSECAKLLATIASQPKARQWAWMRALVQRGDPAFLLDEEDPRSIYPVLDQLGDDFRKEVERLLDKRSDELQKLAEKAEKDRRR